MSEKKIEKTNTLGVHSGEPPNFYEKLIKQLEKDFPYQDQNVSSFRNLLLNLAQLSCANCGGRGHESNQCTVEDHITNYVEKRKKKD